MVSTLVPPFQQCSVGTQKRLFYDKFWTLDISQSLFLPMSDHAEPSSVLGMVQLKAAHPQDPPRHRRCSAALLQSLQNNVGGKTHPVSGVCGMLT